MTTETKPTEDRAPEAPKDTAPKSTKSTKVTQPKRAERKPRTRKKSLKKPLEDLFTSVGSFVYLANQVDGQAIIEGAPDLAESLNEVAKDNDAVYRNLERLVTGSRWGAVISAAAAIALPIAANHGLLPFNIPGVEVPEPDAGMSDIPDLSAVSK